MSWPDATPNAVVSGTKEMTQPCLIYLHVISLVEPTSCTANAGSISSPLLFCCNTCWLEKGWVVGGGGGGGLCVCVCVCVCVCRVVVGGAPLCVSNY